MLNRTNCNSQVLRTYMDVFQGHYKDGTENSRDFRYFSGVFLVARIVFIIQFSLFSSYFSIITLGLCVTVLTFTVAILHPQRCHTHYILDSVFLSFLSVILFYIIGTTTGTHNTVASLVLIGLGIVSITSPQFSFIGLILYWTIRKKKIPQRIWAAIQRRSNADNHLMNAVE
jgi:hypothetical protein